MVADESVRAWNNFIFHSEPETHEKGSQNWAAAVAARFMGQACRGGLNSFLTYSGDVDAQDVVDALNTVGAMRAATQLATILDGLGRPLLSSSEEERWKIIEECWSEQLNEIDALSGEAYSELMAVLETHVQAEQSLYLGLDKIGD